MKQNAAFGTRAVLVLLCLLLTLGCLLGCRPQTPDPAPDDDQTQTDPPQDEPQDKDPSDEQPEVDMTYSFENTISYEVLCNYLSRAVTISLESAFTPNSRNSTHIEKFILNTGAKYICRAATCWNPGPEDYDTYGGQKAFIASVHKSDPDVVFEACVFECISNKVNDIPIPDWVFEAFDLPVQERNFSFDAMCFPDGSFKGQWGEGTAVPDITRQETMLFFYYRACQYILLGYEGLHMGQIHLIGRDDKNWENWTELLTKIRAFAYDRARRGFVFINAHTHGLVGLDGVLLFDFHMYPSRPMADGSQEAHFPTEDDPQRATFQAGHSDSIYGKSLGGMTYSGWECDSLPYLVELDNYGDDTPNLHKPNPSAMSTWGMDEITWYANQPDWYRAEFLEYAYEWVMNEAEGDGFFAMPGQRVARIYDEDNNIIAWQYYAYDSKNHKEGNDDEAVIKEIWESYPVE